MKPWAIAPEYLLIAITLAVVVTHNLHSMKPRLRQHKNGVPRTSTLRPRKASPFEIPDPAGWHRSHPRIADQVCPLGQGS